MGCHFLLQGIFLTQGSKPGLLHCRQVLYHLSHQEGSLVVDAQQIISVVNVNIFSWIIVLLPTLLFAPPLTCVLCARSCPTLWDHMGCPPGPSVHGIFQAILENTGVGYHLLLQRIFTIQGLYPCFLHWQADSLPLDHCVVACRLAGSELRPWQRS